MAASLRPVSSTYRLQLHAGNTFADVAEAVPFLADLGISHLYLSPVLQAHDGSNHGYDTVDVETISKELGGMEGLAHLCTMAHGRGMGIVLDIVPNHLAIGDRANRWWWEVLADGAHAPHAGFFDIDWRSPEPRLRGKIVLPVLDDHYGRALERGAIRVVSDDVELFVVAVGDDLVLPLSAGTLGEILRSVASELDDEVIALASRTLTDLRAPGGRTDAARIADARAAIDATVDRLRVSDPDGVARTIVLTRLADDPVALDTLLASQAYRLARWQVAADELDYRRFLDVNSLVALRTEDPEVFDATHRVIGGLLRDGSVDGLRVDHVDGMADPAGYCARLRALAPRAWLGVEKVLAAGEQLPPWPVDGTTGYDHAALTTPFLVDPRGEERLTKAYQEVTRDQRTWDEHAVAAKAEVLRTLLGSDVARLVELLVGICERRRRVRDFTRVELHDALVAVASHTAGYRSYMRWTVDGRAERTQDDIEYVTRSVRSARAVYAELDPGLFDLLQLLLGFSTGGAAEQELAVRFQQLTVSTTVKGDEDTALYRACRLLALDEVGHDPSRFSVSPDEVHRWAAHIAEAWPRTMLATTTHDTKRSEDVRARLAVLAEVPDDLADAAAPRACAGGVRSRPGRGHRMVRVADGARRVAGAEGASVAGAPEVVPRGQGPHQLAAPRSGLRRCRVQAARRPLGRAGAGRGRGRPGDADGPRRSGQRTCAHRAALHPAGASRHLSGLRPMAAHARRSRQPTARRPRRTRCAAAPPFRTDARRVLARRPGRRSRQASLAARAPPPPAPRRLGVRPLRAGCGGRRQPRARGRLPPERRRGRRASVPPAGSAAARRRRRPGAGRPVARRVLGRCGRARSTHGGCARRRLPGRRARARTVIAT